MAAAKSLSQDRLKGYVVRMRGLPFSASANDVSCSSTREAGACCCTLLAKCLACMLRVFQEWGPCCAHVCLQVLTFFNGVDIVRGIEGVIFTWVSGTSYSAIPFVG